MHYSKLKQTDLTSSMRCAFHAFIVALAAGTLLAVPNAQAESTWFSDTSVFSKIATNGATVSVYFGNQVANLHASVNPGAVWSAPMPASGIKDVQLYVGYGSSAISNVFTANGGTLIITNSTANVIPIIIGTGSSGTGNELIITNGGQVVTATAPGTAAGQISTGYGNGIYVGGMNGAGVNSKWDFTTATSSGSQLSVGQNGGSNAWVVVDEGGVLTNVVLSTYQYSSVTITNGGQVFGFYAAFIGRGNMKDHVGGANASFVLAGTNSAGGNSTFAFTPTAYPLTIGGYNGASVNFAATNTVMRVDAGGLVTNVSALFVGRETNSVGNTLIITNGGQVYLRNTGLGVYVGCRQNTVNNSVSVGGGTGVSLWNLGGYSARIGIDQASSSAVTSNNFVTLFTGSLMTNASITLGGVNNNVYFNGGTLAAGASGNLIATNSTGVNCSAYVQSGGAIINSGTYKVTSQLPLLQDPSSTGGGLTKLGSGTLTLNGQNTYTGPTVITAGTLLCNGNGSTATGKVTVASGATLGGSGTIGGAVTFSAGSHATFSNGATLTLVNSLIIAGGGTIPDVHLNLSDNVPAGNYTLATYNTAGSSGAFTGTPVIDHGSLNPNTHATIVTKGGSVVLQVSP